MKVRVLAVMSAVPLLALGVAGCSSGATAGDIAGDGQRTWVLSEYVLDGESVPIPDYAQDDHMTFNSDGTGLATFGDLAMDDAAPLADDPYTWTLTGDQIEIASLESLHPETGVVTYTITSASPTEMRLQRQYDEEGKTVTLDLAYVALD